jgi:hypothetical protein
VAKRRFARVLERLKGSSGVRGEVGACQLEEAWHERIADLPEERPDASADLADVVFLGFLSLGVMRPTGVARHRPPGFKVTMCPP